MIKDSIELCFVEVLCKNTSCYFFFSFWLLLSVENLVGSVPR